MKKFFISIMLFLFLGACNNSDSQNEDPVKPKNEQNQAESGNETAGDQTAGDENAENSPATDETADSAGERSTPRYYGRNPKNRSQKSDTKPLTLSDITAWFTGDKDSEEASEEASEEEEPAEAGVEEP